MSGTTADSSTSSADERARASADVAHLGKVAFRTFLAISLSWVLEAGPRALHEFGWMSGAAKDAIGLTAYLVLLGVTLYVMRHVRLGKWLQYGIVCAFVLFAMAQFSDVIDETKWAQGIPLLARTSGVHLWLEYNLVLLGGVMLVGTIYWSLIENEMRRRLLIDRSARLEQSLAERRQQEVELTEARERLEREVEERTKELADRNMRLAVELAERRRFEESLGRRLRYEECLAACSQVLLTGGAHSEALEISLRHLADAAGCDRAYVYSYDDEDLARSGVLDLRCMHGDDGPPTVFEMCPRTEWKTMSDGHVIRFGPDCDMNEDCAKALTRSGAKSAILVPLGWEGGWRGVRAAVLGRAGSQGGLGRAVRPRPRPHRHRPAEEGGALAARAPRGYVSAVTTAAAPAAACRRCCARRSPRRARRSRGPTAGT